jgi:hypothetical protein
MAITGDLDVVLTTKAYFGDRADELLPHDVGRGALHAATKAAGSAHGASSASS